MRAAEFVLAAACGLAALLLASRGWTRWRDLLMMWATVFLGIVVLSAARDALPWGLAPASAVALFFALFLRQVPRTIPPPNRERIRSLPPRNHKLLEFLQLAAAGIGGGILTVGESSVPISGILLTAASYLLVALELISRLSSRRLAEDERSG